MLTINNNEKTIMFNRGDDINFIYNGYIDDKHEELYKFKKGDKVTFKIYEKKKYTKGYIFSKDFTITEETIDVEIGLNKNETIIGDLYNKSKIYYYEIILNDKYTMCGHDEDGPKKVIIYPSEKEKNNSGKEEWKCHQ